MGFKKTLIAGLAAAAMLPAFAHANAVWQWNYGAAAAGEGGYMPPLGPSPLSLKMDELKLTAESVILWTSGSPFATGSTFTDYIMLRVDQFNLGGIDNTGPSYGTGIAPILPFFAGIPGDHQITATVKVDGTQTGPNTYSLNGTGFDMKIYYDAGDNVIDPYTFFNFGNTAAVSDSSLLEAGGFIFGNGSNTTAGIPDGSIGLVVGLFDIIGFEVYTPVAPPLALRLGIADGNNNLCASPGGPGTADCDGTTAGILGYFGVGVFDPTLAFHTRTDGSFIKVVQIESHFRSLRRFLSADDKISIFFFHLYIISFV